MAEATKRYAVVTGSNKGIGFERVRQLASKGVTVVLTARDEKRGLEALEKLNQSGLSSQELVFDQLDVSDPSSIASFAHFIKTQFGKLDILVNNAGIGGATTDTDAYKAASGSAAEGEQIDLRNFMTETYESTEECLQINYHGAKRTSEALLPLLQLSNSPVIVNVASSMGKLENFSSEWVKQVLSAESIREESIEQVLTEFLKDFKEGSLEKKGWPASFL